MDDLSPLATELLRGVTDEMITEAAGFREETVESPEAAPEGPGLEATPFPADWRASISAAGYQFIVRWETGGKSYYERVIKGRPIWPGFASGITIGCGFDLGHQSLAHFRQQWGTRLGASDFGRQNDEGVAGGPRIEPEAESVRRFRSSKTAGSPRSPCNSIAMPTVLLGTRSACSF